MQHSMKFLNGNPAMETLFEEGIKRHKNKEPLAPAQKVVFNEIVTRLQAELARLNLLNEKQAPILEIELQKRQMEQEISELKRAITRSDGY